MASEGKEGGGSGGGKLGLGLAIEVPREEVDKLYPEEVRAFAGEGKAADDDTVIIDVRNADYVGGHIPGSIHEPFDAAKQEEVLGRLVPKYADKNRVVFVCLYGEQRSPSIATGYAVKSSEVVGKGGPQVSILLGGFARYMREFWDEREDSACIADFDVDQWVPEEGADKRWVHKCELLD